MPVKAITTQTDGLYIEADVPTQAELTSALAAKENTLTKGNLTSSTTALTVTGGTGAVIGSGTSLAVANATTSTAGLLSSTDKTKLNGIATGATVNSTDAFLLARANHTGTQTASTISDFSEAVDDRVGALLVAGTNVTLNYNDAANTLTINSPDYSSTYQPLDSDLTSIAALTTTTFGRSLLTQADASATRTTLGLGTAATQATTTFLQVANNLSDLNNTSTARTNLGLGTIATQAASNVSITGGSLSNLSSVSSTAYSISTSAINFQTGITYTLVTGDSGRPVEILNASAITVTLPNSLPVGFTVTVYQSGAGQITFTTASGAILRHRQNHTKTAGQWAAVSFLVRANSGGSAAEYVMWGDTAA